MAEPSDAVWMLYRWYDHDGLLLYVGITNNLPRRTREHIQFAAWSRWAAVVDVDPEYQDLTRATARAIEKTVIRSERPIFNRAGAQLGMMRAFAYLAHIGVDGQPFANHMSHAPSVLPAQVLELTARRSRQIQPDELLDRACALAYVPKSRQASTRQGRYHGQREFHPYMALEYSDRDRPRPGVLGLDNWGREVFVDSKGRIVAWGENYLYGWPKGFTSDTPEPPPSWLRAMSA